MRKSNKTTFYLIEEYKGILILRSQTTNTNYYGIIINVEQHFELCKKDGSAEPWKRGKNRLFTYFHNVGAAKKAIDNYLNGDVVYYTDEQFSKYVKNYNSKHSWGFNRSMLLTTLRMHKNGDEVKKLLMEDRLEDANFHSYCAALADNDYNKFMELLNDEFPIN